MAYALSHIVYSPIHIAVTNKHTAKLHHVGSLYILTYDARKLKHKRTYVNRLYTLVHLLKI